MQKEAILVTTALLFVVTLGCHARSHRQHVPQVFTHAEYAKAFGSAFFDGNDFDKAQAAYNRVPAADMGEHDLCNYSMAVYFLQQYSKALSIAQYALTRYPRQAALCRVAFFCATELKRYDEALGYAHRLFHQSDSVKLSYYDYLYAGRLYTITKNYLQADSAFACLADQYPDALEYAVYMRAKVNAQMDPDQTQGLARPYYEQLADLLGAKSQPDDSTRERLIECYSYLLAYYYLQLNDKERASEYARRLLVIDPDNKAALHLLNDR